MYRKYKGPFSGSGQAVRGPFRPLCCWGVRLCAASLLGSAGPMDEKVVFAAKKLSQNPYSDPLLLPKEQ